MDARSLARRVVPAVLIAALAGSNGLFFLRERNAREESDEAKKNLEGAHRTASEQATEAEKKLAGLRSEVASAQGALASAQAAGERDRAKLASLADKLGEAEAERDRLAKHAAELDQLMKLLADKKIDPRRLAGLVGPPRLETEVVSVDERREPHGLVLRAPSLEGLEEGDKLYVTKLRPGWAVIERVDRERGLIAARVGKLEPGEKIAVGDKLATFPP